jgi:hypothetical protein
MKKYKVYATIISGESTVVYTTDEGEAARVAEGIFNKIHGDEIFDLEITDIVEIEKEEEEE